MTILYNAVIVTSSETYNGYIIIDGDTITAVRHGAPDSSLLDSCGQAVDCGGDMLMAGCIDTHVHFREPGLTAKGDIASESQAAVAGGITSYCEMPNTRPATVSVEAWEQKMEIAARNSAANYSFFIGATTDNLDQIRAMDYSRCPGVKIFLGSSTGNMLMNDMGVLRSIARAVGPDIPLAFHAEDNKDIERMTTEYRARYESDPESGAPMSWHPLIRRREACVHAAQQVQLLALHTGAKCILLHASTDCEVMPPHIPGAETQPRVYVETCPQYLLFDDTDYDRLGSRIKCNPAIKAPRDRQALIHAATTGGVDLISTDHAPHLAQDKQGDVFTATSGMPGVQFSLPLMLTLLHDPRVVTRLMAENPARIYGIAYRGQLLPGYRADIVRVARHRHTISDADVISPCGWTPYAGVEVDYTVRSTWVNGKCIWHEGCLESTAHAARPLSFRH